MLNKDKTNIVKATMKYLLVAFIYTLIFFVIVYISLGGYIKKFVSLVNLISIDTNNKILEDIKFDFENKNLTKYPLYGTKYANIIVESQNINLPVYYGDTMSILKNGVGHSSGSYFPGEGGSILYMGHNNRGILYNLSEIENDAIITVKASYGTFNYKVFKTDIINYTEIDKVPINRDEEVLMIYTCYPRNAIGHPSKRFVVYAKLESVEKNEE